MSTMPSSDSYLATILDNISVYTNRFIVPALCILANITNLVSALVFSRKSWKRNVCVCYFNVCLLFNTCYINSSMIAAVFFFGFEIDLLNTSVILCKLYFFSTFLFSTLSPTILILASIDRLLISSQNVHTRLYSSKRLAYFSVGTSTVFWFAFYLHLLIKVNIQQFTPTDYECYYDRSYSYPQFVTYFTLIADALCCFVMIVLAICSFRNVRQIRVIRGQQRRELRSMTKKDFQLLRCLYAHVVVYIVFSISVVVHMVYSVTTANRVRTSLEQAIVNFYGDFSIFLHHVPYCANFLIFFVISRAFRRELNRMIHQILRRDVSVVETNGSEQNNAAGTVQPVITSD